MEIRDGFIVGVYNYCDAWCDRCPFTSHCQLFADKGQMEASLDPNLEPVVTAPEHLSVTPPPPPPWLQELLDEMDEAARTPSAEHAYQRRERRVWFHMMIHVKAMRALQGLAEDPSGRNWPPNHGGSAKVALIGIDRSLTAWRDLVEVGLVSASEVTPFVEDLVWLRASLERTFPKARSFVRAGFDEPEEVARQLRSADC